MINKSFRSKLDTMYRDLRSWGRTHYSPKEFAEDITNDVIVSLLDLYEREGMEWEKKITNLWGYAITAMRNKAYGEFKKRKRRGELVIIIDEIEVDDAMQPTSSDDFDRMDLFNHFKKLSRNSRDIIRDIKITGMKSYEVAEQNNVTASTVRGTLSDNLKKYAKLIQE